MGIAAFLLAGKGGIGVQHYLLDSAWDNTSGALDATATLTIKATHPLRAFHLDFYGLAIHDIRVKDQSAQFSRNGSELTIMLPQTANQGDIFDITIHYGGVITTYFSGARITSYTDIRRLL